MELIIFIVFAGSVFYFLKTRPPLRPVEIEVEKVEAFVGRVVDWSPTVGVFGGTKILLYKTLPPKEYFDDGNFRSDGSISGDLNRIYRAIKQSAKDAIADYEIFSDLSFSFSAGELTPLSELLNIPVQIQERQKKLAAQCHFGDRVSIKIHRYAFRRRAQQATKSEQIVTWIELLSVSKPIVEKQVS